MQKCFLSAGQPDRTKAATVIVVPFRRDRDSGPARMVEAAKKIPGLHCEKGYGPRTQVVCMGWDQTAVENAAEKHCNEENERLQEEQEERERALREVKKRQKSEQLKLHTDYLNSRGQQKNDDSPVGTYILAIKDDGFREPDMQDDLGFSIRRTDTPGIFAADFDFQMYEGVMLISSDQAALDEHCAQADGEDDSEGGYSVDEDESETDSEDEDDVPARGTSKSGTKRKAPAAQPTRAKKPKTSNGQPREYELKLRCREMSEGQIYHYPVDGSIRFKDRTFTVFKGETELPGSGCVVFFARKISDVPNPSGQEWSDYSERAYERARVDRWH